MQSKRTLERHAALVDRMAGALGVDLEEQVLRGALDPAELGDAVLRCTACTSPGACEDWLAQQQGPAEAAPGYCRNADLFSAFRPG